FFSGVDPFSSQFISPGILSRLLNVDLYKEFEFDDEDEAKDGKPQFIYEYGKPVDFFVLIVNGSAQLETGKEKIVSQVGAFSYFGVSALYNPEEKVDDLIRLKSKSSRPYIPDFSVRVCEDVQILRIRRVHWLAAVRATYFETKQVANGGTMLNSDGETVDLLQQELEKADNPDQRDAERDRTMSLQHENLNLSESERAHLLQNAPLASTLSTLVSQSVKNIDSPVTSTTPTLAARRLQELRRQQTTPPPSISGGSSKKRSDT
ncbi:unnamed protein product, partial [Didymodactylos carnosus]